METAIFLNLRTNKIWVSKISSNYLTSLKKDGLIRIEKNEMLHIFIGEL